MNWANRLTVSRLVLTILFVAALNSTWVYGHTAALILFLLAGVTDFFDGEIARRYGSVTNFGKLMDPLVDKIMMAAAFISLVPLEGDSRLGGDDCGGARFLDHGIASDGECARARSCRRNSSGNTRPRGRSLRLSFSCCCFRCTSSSMWMAKAVGGFARGIRAGRCWSGSR